MNIHSEIRCNTFSVEDLKKKRGQWPDGGFDAFKEKKIIEIKG
jgi:hypothetical protein